MVNTFNSDTSVDPIAMLASKSLEWRLLPIPEKASIVKEIIAILQNLTMEDDFVPLLGIPEVQMIGFDITAVDCGKNDFEESHYEAHVVRRDCLSSVKAAARSISFPLQSSRYQQQKRIFVTADTWHTTNESR